MSLIRFKSVLFLRCNSFNQVYTKFFGHFIYLNEKVVSNFYTETDSTHVVDRYSKLRQVKFLVIE